MRVWYFAALALVSSPAVAGKAEDKALAQLKRPVAEIEPLISVKGDALDPSITISSYGATQDVNKGWIASTTVERSFLRAFVDRKTGAVTAQIYHVASYSGSGWNFFNRATYEGPSGLVEVDADRIGSDVNCYRYGCSYTEDLGISVPFATLEAAAAKFDPSNPLAMLKYRVFAKSGQTIDDAVPGNEIAAFVNVVHRAQSRK